MAKFYVTYPEAPDETSVHDTEDEALEAADEYLQERRNDALQDGEWADRMTDLAVYDEQPQDGEGELREGLVPVLACRPLNVRYRPDDLGEDGYDEEGVYWPGGVDSMCDYGMHRIEVTD